MSSPTDPEYLQVDSSVTFDFVLVVLAIGRDFIPVDFSIGNIRVFKRDVNVVKEIVFHIVIVALWVVS